MASAVGKPVWFGFPQLIIMKKNKKKPQSWHIRKVKYYTSKEIAWS